MKKIVISVLFVMCALFAADARERQITVNELPAAAQKMLKTHFANVKVSYVIFDDGLFDKDYKVVLSDGCQIEFDGKGLWESVECKHQAVPDGIVPAAILNYVKRTNPESTIVDIDRQDKPRKGYDIQLSNGLELEFDAKGNFVRVDD